MDRKLRYIIVDSTVEGVGQVLQGAIGNPTSDKIYAVIKNYENNEYFLIGGVHDQSTLIGVVGFKKNKDIIEVMHLSVLEPFRNQGIGSRLMMHMSMYVSCRAFICETDTEGVTFYQNFGFKCDEIDTQWGLRYRCVFNKKNIEIDYQAISLLNQLSSEINKLYGYVKHQGENLGEPAINSGPCGPFAYEFALLWNTHMALSCKIAFLIQANEECWHIVVRLPNGKLFDGGVGVHDRTRYKDKKLRLVVMDSFDINLLERYAYGLDRTYPTYCPDFSLEKITCVISNYLERL